MPLLGLVGFSISLAWRPELAHAIPVDPAQLETAINQHKHRIPEFDVIAVEARRRGLRAYLAGGFAASYGDFVKHQLLAEQGRISDRAERLADQLENVAFPEQDFDLVVARVDGQPETAEELHAFAVWLQERFPQSLPHGKPRWDVIGRRTTIGNRIAAEGDPDFARKNNDSLSIGMIELTDPPPGKSAILESENVAKAPARR